MKIIKIIPPSERNGKRCYFCEETRSVKYVVETFDPVIQDKPSHVYSCNKCVFKSIINKEE